VLRPLYLLVALAACGSSDAMLDAANTTSDAKVDAPPDAPACGTRTDRRGMTRRNITAGGLSRTYIAYVPATADPHEPMPLVFVHHGYTMSGQAMFDLTEYAALSETEHIALAFPDGQAGPNSTGAPWNVGAGVCPSYAGPPPNGAGDDFAFLDAMKADLSDDQCLDHQHVYVTGFSMGGYFAHHAGCMRSDIRAVAPASGGTHDLAGCTNAHRPIIMFHGLSDALVPAGCEDPHVTPVVGVTPAATAWAQKNGCAMTTTTRSVSGGTCYHYDGCPADGQVELCTFPAMVHCWAGGPVSSGAYACPGFASATQLEWQFFKQYAW
jgi:polyhydroxybutyrate depolymerase